MTGATPRLRIALLAISWTAAAAGVAGLVGAALGRWSAEVPLLVLLPAAAGLVASALPPEGLRLRALAVALGAAVAGIVASRMHPAMSLVLMIFGAFACLVVGGVVVASTTARTEAIRAARGRGVAPEAAAVPWARCRSAVLLVLPVALVSALLVPVAAWRPRWDVPAAPQDPLPGPQRDRGAEVTGTGGTDPIDAAGAKGDPTVVMSDDGASDPTIRRRILVQAVPIVGGRARGWIGPVYFRGMTYSTFTSAGEWADDARRTTTVEAKNEFDSNRCRVGPVPPSDVDMVWDMRQTPLVHRPSQRAIVHATAGAHSVSLPSVAFDPDGVILTNRPRGDALLEFRLRARDPRAIPFPLRDTPADDDDPETLGLVSGHPVIEDLAARANVVAGALSSPLERADAIAAHLRKEFSYEPLDGDVSGLPALGEFLAERRGSCLEFAAAAAIMMRSVGLPARLATGFLVVVPEPGDWPYTARGREFHAWTEVRFRGCGWVVFDATPDAPEEDRATRPRPDPWTPPPPPAPPKDEIGAPADGAPELRSLDAELRRVARAILRAGEEFRDRPWLWGVLLAISVLALAWFLRRLSGRDAPDAAPDPLAGVSTSWSAVLAALARRGHVRRPWQTATEFADAVVRAEGAIAAPFAVLTERQQAARFGGRAFALSDDVALARLAVALDARPSARDGSPAA